MRVAAFAILFFVFGLTATTPETLAAQQSNDPPSAPIPFPILTAKKIFISNASGEVALPQGTPDLAYNEFYNAMKNWGRYELVSSPSEANLVFEMRFTFVIGPTGVSQGNGGSTQDFQFRVVILEPKTHVVLWAFSESVPQSTNKLKSRQYFDQTMVKLVDDLKNLSNQPAASGSKN
jgi:hypothetical protein